MPLPTGSAPAGTSLSVVATAVPLGAAAAAVTLDATPRNFIINIPSGATGRGLHQGALLNYTYAVVTPAALVVGGGTSVTVTYTITVSNTGPSSSSARS